MPNFTFEFSDFDEPVQVELPDINAVRIEAIRTLGEIAATEYAQLPAAIEMRVCDERGREIVTVAMAVMEPRRSDPQSLS